jgi:hypothetical protein
MAALCVLVMSPSHHLLPGRMPVSVTQMSVTRVSSQATSFYIQTDEDLSQVEIRALVSTNDNTLVEVDER